MNRVYNLLWDFTMLLAFGLTVYHIYRLIPHIM